MASTNKTPNYNLPLYIGSDKPTYLGDWNESMSAIDTIAASIKADSEGALTMATAANQNANTAKVTADTANTKADNALTSVQGYGVWEEINLQNPNVSLFTSYAIKAHWNKQLKLLSLNGYVMKSSNFLTNDVIAQIPNNINFPFPTEMFIITSPNLGIYSTTEAPLTNTGYLNMNTDGKIFIPGALYGSGGSQLFISQIILLTYTP